MSETVAWVFLFVLLAGIIFSLGLLSYAVWRLGEGMRSIIRFTPSIQLMESILNRPVLTVPGAPEPFEVRQQKPVEGGVYFPGDIGVNSQGQDKAPIMTEEEIKELLRQQMEGR